MNGILNLSIPLARQPLCGRRSKGRHKKTLGDLMVVWKTDTWKNWLDRKACGPAIFLYMLTISHHKIGFLAHNCMFFPSLVRFMLYTIFLTQGRSSDCKLQGAAGPRRQTRPFWLVNWWVYRIICKTTENVNLKVNKTLLSAPGLFQAFRY